MKEKGTTDEECWKHISYIFDGHSDLLLKFQKFLPSETGFEAPKSQVPVPQVQQYPAPTLNPLESNLNMHNDANQYISLIKRRFPNDENSTYTRFIKILKEYQESRRSIMDVAQEVDVWEATDS